MDKPKVSVVIPVYNAQKYITACIDSVLKQTLQDFEIICVDDGSGDDSDSIVREYAKTDDRFVLFSQTNKGVSAARNIGLANARGEYIYFLDSDDYIEPDTLETACHILDAKQLDIVYFDTFAFGEEGIPQEDVAAKNRYYARNHAYSAVYSGKNLLYKMLENKEYSCPVWKQVVRKDFLQKNHVQFFDGIIHEDELYTLQTMLLAERVACIPKTLHHRRLRKDSIMTSSVEFDSVYGYFICVKEAYAFLLQRGYNQKELNEFLSFLKRLMTTARTQYSKLTDTEQKKYMLMPEEDKFLFQLCISDSLDTIRQRDKAIVEKQNLIKEREMTVSKLNELQKNAALLEKTRVETEQKLHDTEAQFSQARVDNRKQIDELQQKNTLLEQARKETERKLLDTEAQFSQARVDNRKQIDELQQKNTLLEQVRKETEQKLRDTEVQFSQMREDNSRRLKELQEKAALLKQNKAEMAEQLGTAQKALDGEREFNRKQLEEKLQKVKQLEQVKQELAREQEFSRKQLDEKLKSTALLGKVEAEAAQKIRALENDIKKAEKERENCLKQLKEEKEKYTQLTKRNEEAQKNLKQTKKQAETVSRELNNVKSGWSFKTGRIITFVPRKIRDWLK